MIYSIQYLRAVAAQLICVLHFGFYLPGAGYDLAVAEIGVDVFFVISGFVM